MPPRLGVVYEVSPDETDWFPIYLRPECDRTFFNAMTGKDESLFDIFVNAQKHGWTIREKPPTK